MTLSVQRWPAPQWLPPRVARDWERLATASPEPDRFDPAMVAELPDPARRWLTHVIAPGTVLRHSVVLAQHGEIRLGSWRTFHATQVLAPLKGFVWAVTTRVMGIPIAGFDRFTHGEGQMRHRWWGRVPLVSAGGADITRSAAGRLASELVLVPAVGLAEEVRWRWRQVDRQQATVRLRVGGEIHPVTLTVDGSGALQRLTVSRWARLGGGPFRWHPFTVVVDEESSFDGYTIPTRLTAGYDDAVEGPFIRLTIDHATYL
jgi:uncharacterized protein DUF6544